jgi:hypothetical protein
MSARHRDSQFAGRTGDAGFAIGGGMALGKLKLEIQDSLLLSANE